MNQASLVVVSLSIAAFACGEPLQPTYGDPSQFAFAEPALFRCDAWVPSRPAVALGLFDVYFGSIGTGPTGSHVKWVARNGGSIVRRFTVPGLRAVLPVEAVERLDASRVQAVVDPGMVSHRVMVGYDDAINTSKLRELGGEVISMFGSTVVAIVPDDAIPALRRDPGVRYVDASGGGCFARLP